MIVSMFPLCTLYKPLFLSIILSKDLFQTNIYPLTASWQIKIKAKVATPLVMVNVWTGTETNYNNLHIKKELKSFLKQNIFFLPLHKNFHLQL